GTLDLVPEVLRDAGVQSHFHKVALKPGKPIFFGARGDTLVFGLPGNPVSAFVGFTLFVGPAIKARRAVMPAIEPAIHLPLAEPFRYSSDRPTYHPARIEPAETGERVRAVAWHGAPDLIGLSSSNALMVLPAGELDYPADKFVPVLRP